MNARQGWMIEATPIASTWPVSLGRGRSNAPARSRRTPAVAMAIAVALLATACCGGKSASTPTPVPAAASPVVAAASTERVTLRGHLTLDGAPVESRFLGVRVVRDG